jgi:hypothetical protein
MMTKNWIFSILAAALLAESGCGQRQRAPQPTIIKGVKVDLAKFQQAFAGVSPDIQTTAFKVPMSIRYGQYAQAVAELERLCANTGLTEQQKKVATEVLDQLRQVVSNSQAKPAQ